MRDYEVTVVLKPDIDDEARAELIGRVEGWLTHGDQEGDAPSITHWGQMSMAYPIRKYREGYYVFFEAKLNPTQVSEIERNIQYLDDILRHLVVRNES